VESFDLARGFGFGFADGHLHLPILGVVDPVSFFPAVALDFSADFVAGDGAQPGANGRSHGEFVEVMVGKDKRLVSELVHQVGYGQPQRNEGVKVIQMAVHQESEGLGVAAPHGLDQRRVAWFIPPYVGH
jgi:hypothetical protein